MRIDAIELYLVAMPLITPWRTAYGEDATVESVLVRLVSGDSYGWGETCPLASPTYSPEWARGVFMTMREWMAPRLLGQDITSGQQLQERLSLFKGNYFAKAGLDLAWWDLHARQQGQPLWRLLGGSNPVVEIGADIGVLDHLDDLLAQIAQVVEAGYSRLKLKYRPGWELNMLAAVRHAFPDLVLHIDCNSAYSLADLPMFLELEQYDLAMIEQPLAHDDLVDHAKLQQRLRTPICLDESIVSVQRARQALELQACRWINIKPGRVGGITNAVAIHNLSKHAGVGCWIGGMLESSLGQSFNLALATLSNIRYPSDIFQSDHYYREDLGEPRIIESGRSQITASSQPGVGCEPNPELLARMQLDRVVIA